MVLHLGCQALYPEPHIGMAEREPHPRARWDHRTALDAADASAGGADAEIRRVVRWRRTLDHLRCRRASESTCTMPPWVCLNVHP